MRIIKWILIILGVLIAAFLIIAAVSKKDFNTEKTITINKPVSEVYNFMQYLKNHDKFSKWQELDPNIQKTFTGTDGQVGFVSAWKGNDDVGVGEQEIKALKPNERIDTEVRFKEPFESKADGYFVLKPIDSNSTEVTWGFSSVTPFPYNGMMVFMNMEKAIGADYEYGLNKLKKILESN